MPTAKFNSADLHIILSVQIKAKLEETAMLALDTGASFVVIPWKFVHAIGIQVDPNKFIKTTTASSVETVPEIIIPEMSVLGQKVKNVKAIIKDLPPGVPVDGLLGLSFLKYFKLTLDFKKGLLSLE